MFSEQLEEKRAQVSTGERVMIAPFSVTLSRHDLKLDRDKTNTLQINVGFLCNQTCRHCHLNAGPIVRKTWNRELLKR